MNDILNFKNLFVCRLIERESKRRRVRKIERDPHNLERKASTDHPIGEGLG